MRNFLRQLAKAMVALLLLALVLGAIPARAQQEKLLPGEDQDRMQVLFETNQQLQSGVVVNAARVRALQREVERLTAEAKVLREKCGKSCEEKK